MQRAGNALFTLMNVTLAASTNGFFDHCLHI